MYMYMFEVKREKDTVVAKRADPALVAPRGRFLSSKIIKNKSSNVKIKKYVPNSFGLSKFLKIKKQTKNLLCYKPLNKRLK